VVNAPVNFFEGLVAAGPFFHCIGNYNVLYSVDNGEECRNPPVLHMSALLSVHVTFYLKAGTVEQQFNGTEGRYEQRMRNRMNVTAAQAVKSKEYQCYTRKVRI
jgi:hypothetical protein